MKATVFREKLTIPTYRLLEENINSTFAHYNGIYIYPYKLQDVISKEKQDRCYDAVILQNDYTRCTVLPELGGRLYSVENSKDGTQWFYKNRVIKPALIGTRGAWFSGGVEFNFPVSHNPNTFDRVNYFIRESDGFASVFFGNREAISGMNWTVELRLYDDCAYLEQRTSLQNESLMPNRYYFWTNAAAETSTALEYIYPFDLAVGDASEDYIKWPEDAGCARNWDKNNRKPVEFFGKNINRAYFGTYDHDKDRGVVHVANPRQLRGAKIFSWGWGNEARVWRRVLTDDDTNYVELQSGPFETQKVFELMEVLDEKSWSEEWFQIRDIKGFDIANRNGALKLLDMEGKLAVSVYLAVDAKAAELVIFEGSQAIFSRVVSIPCNEAAAFATELGYGNYPAYRVELRHCGTKECIISYSLSEKERTVTASDRSLDKDIIIRYDGISEKSIYTRVLENLKRDWPDKAEELLQGIEAKENENLLLLKAITELKHNRPESAELILEGILRENPFNDRARFYLGALHFENGCLEKARDRLLDIDINSLYHKKANILLAMTEIKRNDFSKALESLSVISERNLTVLWLQAFCFRRLKAFSASFEIPGKISEINPIYLKLYWEQYCSSTGLMEEKGTEATANLRSIAANDIRQYIDLAFDYTGIGAYDDALDILSIGEEACGGSSALYYHMANIFHLKGMFRDERDCLARARQGDITAFCPSRHGEYVFLKRYSGCSGEEEYLLGSMQMKYKNFKEACALWLESESMGFVHSTLYRNIAWYYVNIEQDCSKALPYLEKAKEMGAHNIDVLLYLNSTYKKLKIKDPERKRSLLAWAGRFGHSFAKRCMVDIYCQLEEYDEAVRVLLGNTFDIWERETDEDLRMSKIYHKAFFGLLEKSLAERDHVKAGSCISHLQEYPPCVNIWFKDSFEIEDVKNKIRELLLRYGYDYELL